MMQRAKEILKKYYGYDNFREGQEKIIESILTGNDTFAIMPTGAGKSVCFQVPALMFEGVTLVISPLISLMKDQVDDLDTMGIPATFINSSLSFRETRSRINKAMEGDFKLIYIAPERLENEDFLETIKELRVSMVAVDEAHCVSQWGHDFRPSYRYISSAVEKLNQRPIISAFTATATEDVKEDIVKLLKLQNPNAYVTGFNRENLCFGVVRGENKKDYVLGFLDENKDQSGIIYAATRKEVDRLHETLKKKGYSVGKYHAGLKDDERIKNQDAFLYDDVNIMVATNAFGMGIDKSNVRYVIHYNLPRNMEAYYQEAGRAGRDGEPSQCILLFGAQDVILQKYLIEETLLSPQRKANEYKKLQEMVDYCHTRMCLRKYILEYFGEEGAPDNCGNCSICNDEAQLADITVESQKIFSCIYRMRERFGSTMIADVLRGSKNKKVIELGFNSLSTYGIMKEYNDKEIKDIINVLIADGYLYLTEGKYPIVKLTEKSMAVLKDHEPVLQRVEKKEKRISQDNSLFGILKNIRKDISGAEGVPPYVIFPDSSIREMSQYYPTTEKSMLAIKGVGEIKLKKYGEQFLQAIREYLQNNDIKIDEPKEELETNKPKESKETEDEKIPSHVITLNLYKEGKALDEIAMARQMTSTTLQAHVIRCFEEGLDINIDDFIPKEYEDLIVEKIREKGHEKLKPIKEALPEEVDYFAIKAVIAKYKDNL